MVMLLQGISKQYQVFCIFKAGIQMSGERLATAPLVQQFTFMNTHYPEHVNLLINGQGRGIEQVVQYVQNMPPGCWLPTYDNFPAEFTVEDSKKKKGNETWWDGPKDPAEGLHTRYKEGVAVCKNLNSIFKKKLNSDRVTGQLSLPSGKVLHDILEEVAKDVWIEHQQELFVSRRRKRASELGKLNAVKDAARIQTIKDNDAKDCVPTFDDEAKKQYEAPAEWMAFIAFGTPALFLGGTPVPLLDGSLMPSQGGEREEGTSRNVQRRNIAADKTQSSSMICNDS